MLSPFQSRIPKIEHINTAKKYITYSPNSKDSNYINYTKEQSITNYLKNNNRNMNNVINNAYFNINKTNIFRQYNTYSNIKKNNSYNNTTLNNNTQTNNSKKILLTSLFNLPNIPHKDKNKHSSRSIKNKLKPLFLNNNLDISKSPDFFFQNSNERSKTEENEGIKLENYMRDKFYEDIDKKMTIKLKSKNFCHDNSIRDRIIKMNKIGLFWGSVFEYCNPLLSGTKFKFARKLNQKEKMLKDDDINVNEYKSKINKDSKPILYTNSLFSKLKHKEKIKKELLFYNNDKKTSSNK